MTATASPVRATAALVERMDLLAESMGGVVEAHASDRTCVRVRCPRGTVTPVRGGWDVADASGVTVAFVGDERHSAWAELDTIADVLGV